MDYLQEINQSLHNLRETNKQLKQKVSQSNHDLAELRAVNIEQHRRIEHLEALIASQSMISANNDDDYHSNESSIKRVLNGAKHSNDIQVLDSCDYNDPHFERQVSELALQAVRIQFADYTEMADYLKQEIRSKTGTECLVGTGVADFMREELCNRYDKLYGNHWLVSVGVGHHFDHSYGTRSGKHSKFIDFLINELRITVFQV
ncbi:unnamed protein product [Medioppia subpectinata]|uniref:Uncharacterized protein n=1 Tax=Medioppia subpectinata TaxID=1979941 RepID=A0A7R9L4T1_9ACAR|nr:unnamed protein product [Medioppia subpectinata]CAG2115556.1 unnamed protein product [Medioppia subpectinata]